MTEITHPLLDWLDKMIDESSSEYEQRWHGKVKVGKKEVEQYERWQGRREALLQCRNMAIRLVSQPVTVKCSDEEKS